MDEVEVAKCPWNVVLFTHPHPLLSLKSVLSQAICRNPHLCSKYSNGLSGIAIVSIHKELSEGQSSPKENLKLCLMDLPKALSGLAHVSSNYVSVPILQAPNRYHL